MPIGDAKPFQAGEGNIIRDVAVPLVNAGAKVVSAARAARKDALAAQAKKDKEEQKKNKGSKPKTTKVMPVAAPVSSGPTVWDSAAAAKASVRRNPDHFLPRSTPGQSKPSSLSEVPQYSVNKAMVSHYRGQVSGAIHRASSSLQFKNDN